MVDWLNGTFVAAVNAVIDDPHGTLREAMVVARILNSSGSAMRAAVRAAGDEPDVDGRISAELEEYAKGNNTRARRVGIMRRPSAATRFLAAT